MKKLIAFCFLTVLILSSIACKRDLFKYKLIAYYPFSGDAKDKSENHLDGHVNEAVLTTDRKGNEQGAYAFNGKSAYITIPNFGNATIGSEISVSIWAKTNVMASSFALLLVPDNGARFGLSVNYNHNSTNSIFWDYGWLHQGGNSPGRLYTFEEPFDTQWHHYVVTSSYTKKLMEIYKDGKLLCSKQQSLTMAGGDRVLKIGSGDNANYFNGSLDDIRIYNRILSSGEIITLSRQ